MVHSPPSRSIHLEATAALTTLVLALGCATGNPPSGPAPAPQLRGHIHGGQQPVSGASIQLFAAGASGYGAGAVPLLSSPVFSDANGAFSLSGSRSCPSAASQLYVVATGGNPGLAPGTNNPSLAMMAVLGPCKLLAGQPSLDPGTFVNIDEITTVASVYALAGFMDPATAQIGASSTNAVGIANAFATVTNLVDISSGQARAITSAGNGTVPQSKINTLADILAPCINSTGTGPACATLFAAATPTGGTAPSNTLQATFNIAQHPANSVAALYAQGSSFAPFQPTLTAAPNDWTLAVTYTASGVYHAADLAIDGSGNIWILNAPLLPATNASAVTLLSNSGAVLSGAAGFIAPGLNAGCCIAIDPAGNAWIPASDNRASGSGRVIKLSSAGTSLSGTSGYSIPTLNVPGGIAIDGAGSAWIPNGNPQAHGLFKVANDGTLLSGPQGFSPGGFGVNIDSSGDVFTQGDGGPLKYSNSGTLILGDPGSTIGGGPGASNIVIDASDNSWRNVPNEDTVSEFSSTGVLLSPTFRGGFPYCFPAAVAPYQCTNFYPAGVAIDGASNIWVPDVFTAYVRSTPTDQMLGFAEISNTGVLLSGNTGYGTIHGTLSNQPGIFNYASLLAIDNSGNIWAVDFNTNIVLELIGVAVPVTTPLSVGVRDHKLGTRP